MSDELGRMSTKELGTYYWDREYNLEERGEITREQVERARCAYNGAPGRAAMLSRAQVRACLGPLLGTSFGGKADPLFAGGYYAAIHAAACALLNLGPGEKSPLEED